MANAITRTLKLQNGSVAHDVPVRVFWPVADVAAWDCRWEIDWPDGQRANSGRGVDAIQALINAFQMIGAEIYCSEAHKSGRLTWDSGWIGYGFPVAANLRNALSGDDRRFL